MMLNRPIAKISRLIEPHQPGSKDTIGISVDEKQLQCPFARDLGTDLHNNHQTKRTNKDLSAYNQERDYV